MRTPTAYISSRFVGLLALCACAILTASATIAQSATRSDTEAAVLARVPPKSPADAQKCFEVTDGFRIELAAAEPLVVDPVAMAFDDRGRLYVVEMCDYSEQDHQRLGKIRLLSDENGDGHYENSRVFAEDLSWPTAIACYDGGVFVGAAPDILYCKDTDGDGAADVQRVVFTGFGRGNVQGLLNSFQWGLDHRIYGATSSSGGVITRPGDNAPPLDLRGRDFVFDPKTLEIAAITGGGQHGLSFNRWGDRFVCSNSDHLQAIVFEERYLARNPYQSVASARRSIAADGPQAAVYRTSPIEGWRIARTGMRLAGLAAGPIEGGGQPAGYFTGATGVTIYEGGLWDADESLWAIVADVGSNLIHRKRLVPDGVTFRGERIDPLTEFVRSSDIWFRPVQFAIGPEGALYVADMYREVIEHPASLPPELKRQLDLTSGRDRGRIYRIVPADYRQTPPPSPADRSLTELAEQLDAANAWRRMTASRLIYERQDPAAASRLRDQYHRCERAEGRIAVLYALESLAALTDADLVRGLADSHPQVCRHALRLAEPRLNSSAEVREHVLQLSPRLNRAVEFQLALTLGECDDPRVARKQADILVRNLDSADMVGAVLTSLHTGAGPVLRELLATDSIQSKPQAAIVLEALVRQIAEQQRDDDMAILVRLAADEHGGWRAEGRAAMLRALARLPAATLTRSKTPQLQKLSRLRRAAVAQLVDDSLRVLQRNGATLDERVAAIADLGLDSFQRHRALLEQLLSPREAAAIHAAVLAACAGYDAPEVADLALAHWSEFAPAQRASATGLLLRRKAWALALVRHLSAEGVPLASLDPGHAAQLLNYPVAEVSAAARALGGQRAADDRRRVFQDYRDAVPVAGDPITGKALFQKNCASCHEIGGQGHAVGPSLAAMVGRGRESLLLNILAPNGEVDPRYLQYMLLTADGQYVSGLIAGESATAVTLCGPDRKMTTVLRVDIDEMHNTGKSLMPEGFEKLIDHRAMADLLAYLEAAAATGESSK